MSWLGSVVTVNLMKTIYLIFNDTGNVRKSWQGSRVSVTFVLWWYYHNRGYIPQGSAQSSALADVTLLSIPFVHVNYNRLKLAQKYYFKHPIKLIKYYFLDHKVW